MGEDEAIIQADKININEDTSRQELIEHISVLEGTIEKQNQTFLELKNRYIRLENNMKLIESNVEYYSTYKRLCEIILDRINRNPFSALWFLRSVRKKIEDFRKEN